MERQTQKDLFRRMAQPSFYPHAPTAVEVVDSHISRVFLTGKYAYKIKRSLVLPFLDFRRLEDRRRYCEAEVALNRRLAADTYLGVVPIHQGARGGTLKPEGPVVEYAVQMRQLAPKASLAHLLRHGGVDSDAMGQLAECLARFHARAQGGAEVTARGAWHIIGAHCRDNFRDAAEADQPLARDARFKAVAAVSEAFWFRHKALFQRRETQNRIREGHGDLRCEHIYLRPRLEIIDCLEFDANLRCGDVAADLGFLLMDMDRHGVTGLANDLLATYASLARDPDIYALIDFYKCYRAMVRIKINCLQLAAGGHGMHAGLRLKHDTESLLACAYGYARRLNRPILFVTCGLPASGKSTLAKALAVVFDLPVLRSDAVRKVLFDIPPGKSRVSAYQKGIYSPTTTVRTYARLLQEAHKRLGHGGSVILDATFARRSHRKGLLELTRQTRSGLVVIHCTCPLRHLKERLGLRRSDGQLSDARLTHLDALKTAFEPLDDLPAEIVVPVATDHPVEESLLTILAHAYTCPWRHTVIPPEA